MSLILRTCAALTVLSMSMWSCAGSEVQDVLLASTPGGQSSGSPGTSGSAGTSGGNGTSGGGGTSGGPQGNCEPEQEPNDNRNNANELQPARCGSLSQSDQRDFLTFTLKPTTKTMSINFDGDIRIKVTVPKGPTLNLSRNEAPQVPFSREGAYYMEVEPFGERFGDWRVEVIER